MPQDFNATLNLPKTDFPMRAGLPKREPEMLKRWEEQDIYNEMLKKNEGHPRFSLHDGPPFSNGALHMGHALNKSIKDIIVRSYAMRGYYTPYIPGWDNHGMPIESAIIKEQKLNHKAMSVADFRSACHDYAEKYIGLQMEGFKRLGVVGDWEHPYKTMNKGFEADEVLQGLVQGVTHVQRAVGERRAVMEVEQGLALVLLQQLVIEVDLLPVLEHLRLPLGQTRPHGKAALGHVQCLFVFHVASPFYLNCFKSNIKAPLSPSRDKGAT